MSLVFVDTNILAYARDPRDPRKQAIAMDWLRSLAIQRAGRLSRQVLIEFYAVATHPRKLAMVETAAQADVLALEAWNPVQPDAELLKRAWGVQSTYGFSWWDAMVVAAALNAGCAILLSEDLQHEQCIEGTLTIIDPFAMNAPRPERALPAT